MYYNIPSTDMTDYHWQLIDLEWVRVKTDIDD